jgi:cysteinyl-tRNA synthetase
MRKVDEFYERLMRGKRSARKGGASTSKQPVKTLLRSFELAMDDDLNTPKALASLFSFQRKVNALIDSKGLSRGDCALIESSLKKVDDVLGVVQFQTKEDPPGLGGPMKGEASLEIKALVEEREEARKLKDYAKADSIRERLKEKGVLVQDTAEGPVWRKLSTPT